MTSRASYAFVRIPSAALDALSLPQDHPSHIGAAELAVLAVLARHANDEGQAWPAVATLAKKSGFSPRHVQGLLHRLERAGLIVREARAGRCTCYVIQGANHGAGVHRGSGVNSSAGVDVVTPEIQFVGPRTAVHPGVNHSAPNLEALNKNLPNIEQQQESAFFEIEKSDEEQLRTLATSRHVDFDSLRQKAAQHYRGQSLRKPAVAVLRDWLERERPTRASRRGAGTTEDRKAALRKVGETWNPEAARG